MEQVKEAVVGSENLEVSETGVKISALPKVEHKSFEHLRGVSIEVQFNEVKEHLDYFIDRLSEKMTIPGVMDAEDCKQKCYILLFNMLSDTERYNDVNHVVACFRKNAFFSLNDAIRFYHNGTRDTRSTVRDDVVSSESETFSIFDMYDASEFGELSHPEDMNVPGVNLNSENLMDRIREDLRKTNNEYVLRLFDLYLDPTPLTDKVLAYKESHPCSNEIPVYIYQEVLGIYGGKFREAFKLIKYVVAKWIASAPRPEEWRGDEGNMTMRQFLKLHGLDPVARF